MVRRRWRKKRTGFGAAVGFLREHEQKKTGTARESVTRLTMPLVQAWQRELDELKKSAEVDRAKVEKMGDDVAVMETLIYNVQRLTNYEEKQNEIQRRRSTELE